jgi:hypothetical protein
LVAGTPASALGTAMEPAGAAAITRSSQ